MKETIRRQMRQTRRALSTEQQQEAAICLWLEFRKSPLFLNSKRLGIYLANDGEIDPSFLADNLLTLKRNLYLPCLDVLGINRLTFTSYARTTSLLPNKYGIPEPSRHKERQVKPVSLDLVLVPLVAFDDNGHRLGMGGGFYDRTFAFKKESKQLGPKLIGLAHECQRTDNLCSESWDISLDGVLTDQRFIEL